MVPAPATDPTPIRSGTLADLLRDMIVQEGPVSIERYMALALGHPSLGYYMTRDPFGAAGDFTTAPEISQMFGELLGLWAADVWLTLGAPEIIHVVELGPGRGTLMADAIRAALAVPPFHQALRIHLVETSPVLRQVQKRALAQCGATVTWHDTVETLPAGPMVVFANEFFDALPIRQFVRTTRGWCERLVGLDGNGDFRFGLAPEPKDMGGSSLGRVAVEGDVVEVAPAAHAVIAALSSRIVAEGGALLAIDYGSTRSGFADTLQAVSAHRFVDPLVAPGEADLTAHVDFAALAATARKVGVAVHGPATQGAFLRDIGIVQRASALKTRATPAQAAAIDAALSRLTGPEPGMGALFKVLALTSPESPTPPGFLSELRS